MEDKVIFQQAFQYHGKNFQRIRTMLPKKPISSLVKYYYLWKRSYSQYSLMDSVIFQAEQILHVTYSVGLCELSRRLSE